MNPPASFIGTFEWNKWGGRSSTRATEGILCDCDYGDGESHISHQKHPPRVGLIQSRSIGIVGSTYASLVFMGWSSLPSPLLLFRGDTRTALPPPPPNDGTSLMEAGRQGVLKRSETTRWM